MLRPYQKEGIKNIKKSFSEGKKHIILQAPTGSGKTVMFSDLAKKTADSGNKVLILTDRIELLMQAGGAIKLTGMQPFFIQAGCKIVSNDYNCYVAMAKTLKNRINKSYWINFLQNIDLVIIDECHKQDFNYIFDSVLKNKHIIGFTATPKRSGKMRQLALDYEDIVETVNVEGLIQQGYLIGDDYYGLEAPDMSGVQIDTMKGDYKENQMFKQFNKTQLYAGVIDNYKDICPETKTICFCVNIEHCIKTAQMFNDAGISARFIVSNMTEPKLKKPEDPAAVSRYNERMKVYDLYKSNMHLSGGREQVFKDFADNKFKVLVNAGIATTGYDCPDCETIILNRATTSTTLLLQMIGRGSRIYSGKTHFNILDFGSNCERLGYYTENRIWSLWHDETGGDGLPPIKTCGYDSQGQPISEKKGCRRPILAAYNICPFCGFVYPKEKELKNIDLQAIMFDNQKKKAIKTKRIKDMTMDELYNYWKTKGHKTSWLWRQLWYRGRESAVIDFGRKNNWNRSTVSKAINFGRKL